MDDPVSEWASQEYITPVPLVSLNFPATPHLLKMQLNEELPFRRLFLYVEPQLGNAVSDFVIEAEISLWLGGSVIEKMPVSDAQDVNNALLGSQSIFGLACCAAASASNTKPMAALENSLKVTLSKKFHYDTVILNPHRFVSNCDRLSYSVIKTNAYLDFVTGIRVFAAVQSQNYAF